MMKRQSYHQQGLLCLQLRLGAVASHAKLCDAMIMYFVLYILIQLTIENMHDQLSKQSNQGQFVDSQQNPQKMRGKLPKQTVISNRRQQESAIIYPNYDYTVCTKYNKCMEEKLAENVEDRSFDQSNQTLFDIPPQILAEQQPRIIQILPSNPYTRDTHQTDLIVQNNIKQKIYIAKLQKKKQKEERELIKQRLKQLQQVAKEKLKNAPKVQLNIEKATKWGHSIFGQIQKQQFKQQQLKNAEKQREQIKNVEKDKSLTKIAMKPIKQRISQYKNQEKKQQIKKKELIQCDHKHTQSQKDIQQKNMQIEKNAKQVLKKMREQKLKSQQRKNILKGKIRAIQIESRQSLKKFKKKPVDPAIQFKVDIQIPTNQKKSKKGTNSQNSLTSEDILKAESIKENLKKLQSFQNNKNKKKMRSTTKQSEKILKKVKQQHQKLELKDGEIQIEQNQGTPSNKKFYFWDIPIYKQDYSKLQNDYYQQMLTKQKPKRKTFRDQVDQYLNEKFHKTQQQNIKERKQKRLHDLVQMKKQQFLREYQSQQSQMRNIDEVFWNEDQLYKLHPISNF